ncbi:hypothetical protein [Psychrobacter nivimaris]|uniref:hypothetical protein n=1 Tax=Psychrobacter nivimaris TaxID=281738 RepID=UPI00191B09CB|nr:hypothetical protein [Psychrobacter nivimaris]
MSINDIGIILGVIGIILTIFFGIRATNNRVVSKKNGGNISKNVNSGNGNQFNIGGNVSNISTDRKSKDRKK